MTPTRPCWTSAEHRIGFRTVTVDTSPDDTGSAFTFVVNGTPVFVRGANWIPDDCFPTRLSRDRVSTRIDQAMGANLNLLRVWGGGLYESDEFYELCDEKGVLVWQDFLFACAAYPEEEPLRGEVIAEARDNVTRLMPHASLAIWNGCNENIWGYRDWGWEEAVGDRTWGLGYYLDILPAIVAEVDPGRFYYPGSPYSGTMAIHPNADDHGLRHIWDVWNDRDYTVYAHYTPRFVAEFGYQAPPTTATVYRWITERPLTPNSPGMLHHQKAVDGNLKLERGAANHLPGTADFDDWLYLMQVQQAEAVRFGIEHFRSHRGRCMGTVVWQLNDCWPVTSWAAVDGDGRRKLLWYALRDACAPHLLTVQPRDGALQVFGINDSTASWRGDVTVERMRFDGTVLAAHRTRLVVERLSSNSISLPASVSTPDDPAAELLVARTPSGAVALHFFAADKDLRLHRSRARSRGGRRCGRAGNGRDHRDGNQSGPTRCAAGRPYLTRCGFGRRTGHAAARPVAHLSGCRCRTVATPIASKPPVRCATWRGSPRRQTESGPTGWEAGRRTC